MDGKWVLCVVSDQEMLAVISNHTGRFREVSALGEAMPVTVVCPTSGTNLENPNEATLRRIQSKKLVESVSIWRH